MYAEIGLLFPYSQNFSLELHQLEEYCKTQKPNASLYNLAEVSNIYEYELVREGDLFKAPETIVEEPVLGLDLVEAAISMFSEDVISSQGIKTGDMNSLQNEPLLNTALYECEKKLLEEEAAEAPFFEIMDTKKIQSLEGNENEIQDDKSLPDVPFQKSLSLGSLSSIDWMHGTAIKHAFLDFPGMDFSVYGMRRAYSEGDIMTLGNQNGSLIQSSSEKSIGVSVREERQEQLWRYRNKKSKRNFGRKIKYACRKALADSQPRVRGRFAKTEEPDVKRR